MREARQSSGETSKESTHGPLSLRQVVEGLRSAANAGNGISIAICRALRFFDHHDVPSHDLEVDIGAAHVLCQLLGRIIGEEGRFGQRGRRIQTRSVNESRSVQISTTCGALEMVFRCSNETIWSLFAIEGHIQGSEPAVRSQPQPPQGGMSITIMPLLVNLLEEFATSGSRSGPVRIGLRSAVRILRRISEVSALLPIIVAAPGTTGYARTLLALLIRTVQGDVSPRTRCDAVVIMADIATLQLDNAETIADLPGLLDALLYSAKFNSTTRGWCGLEVAQVLMNLSNSHHDALFMGNRGDVLDLLVTWIHNSNASSETVRTECNEGNMQFPRRLIQCAAKTLRNLSTCAPNKSVLATHRNGQFLDSLAAAIRGTDDIVRDFSLCTARHIATEDEASIVAIACHVDLVLAIIEVANGIIASEEEDNLTENEACNDVLATLTALIGSAPIILLPAEVVSEVISALANILIQSWIFDCTASVEALCKLSASSPIHRKAMAQSNLLCKALVTFSSHKHCGGVGNLAMETVHNLCMEPANQACICNDEDIFNLLVAVVSGTLKMGRRVYLHAVASIVCLSAHEPNLKRMAKFGCLVPSLIEFSNGNKVNNETKTATVKLVVLLSRVVLKTSIPRPEKTNENKWMPFGKSNSSGNQGFASKSIVWAK